MNIAIVGIGGVGGYLAAMLIDHAQHNPSAGHNITLVARPAHAQAIAQQGLQVQLPDRILQVQPPQVEQQLPHGATQDLIICCTKSYDLAPSLAAVQAGIAPHTAILPLLNGVGATEYLQAQLPHNLVLDGCVYIIAKLQQHGVVQVTSTFQRLHWGAAAGNDARCDSIQAVFEAAGIEAVLEANIRQAVWEKFFFISPMACSTCAADASMHAVLAHPLHRAMLLGLMQELTAVAAAEGHTLPQTLFDLHLTRYASLPQGTASSMHHDMRLGKATEIDALVHYVIRTGAKHGVPTPTYARALALIETSSQQYLR